MAIQFITTSEFTTKDLHKGIAQSAARILYASLGDNQEDESAKFLEGYRSAMKASLSALSQFIIEKGRILLESDLNSNIKFTRAINYTFSVSEYI